MCMKGGEGGEDGRLDSMSNSFLSQQRPITASPSSPRQQLLLQIQASESYSATTNAATAAMGMVSGMSVSPHTPAIPSRLSAASNIDYGDGAVAPGTGTSVGVDVPPPKTVPGTEIDVDNATLLGAIPARSAADSAMESKESTVETTTSVSGTAITATTTDSTAAAAVVPDTTATTTTTANALPIDIPSSSPRRFIGSAVTHITTSPHRRHVSAAPKPRNDGSRDPQDSDEDLPFIKTLSLGNESAKEAPSLGDLLRGRPGIKGGGDAAASAECGEVDDVHATCGDAVTTTAAGGCSRATPDPNSTSGKNGGDSLTIPSSYLASVLAASVTANFDKTSRIKVESSAAPSAGGSLPLCGRPSVTSTSTLSGTVTATATNRRSAFLPQRPSFHRPPTSAKGGHRGDFGMQMQQGSAGSLDEDEPLLFVMTDVGASGRSLEDRERIKENERGQDVRKILDVQGDGAGGDADMAKQMGIMDEN
ncbi:hypothetical protein KEM54_002680 [Ascosphaera aggregata]|nr:hypothetical protein KEM54_002680 [Ascosphaera aggregata]